MSGTIFNGTYANGLVLSDPATQNPATIGASGRISITHGSGLLGNAVGTPWQVSNFGSIYGNYYGVSLQAGGTITNAGGGYISGIGIAGGLGTVSNAGSVQGRIRLNAGGSVTNAASGAVSGGVDIAGTAGSVGNAGTLGYIYFTAGGSVTNLAGSIGNGVHITGAAGTVVNAAAIDEVSARPNFAGVNLGSGGSVNNMAGATITSGADGIAVRGSAGAAATVTNAGVVTVSQSNANYGGGSGNSVHARAVYLGVAGTVSNAAGGTITASGTFTQAAAGLYAGVASGVFLKAGGTVTNAGSISGSGTWVNAFSRSYAVGAGVFVPAAGNVTNTASGAITARFAAVDIVGAGTVSNAGTMVGTAGYGVTLNSGGSITNSFGALISGGFDGIRAVVLPGVSVSNAGSINGVQNYAIRLDGGYAVNLAGGQLSGGNDGVLFDTAGGTLVNSGSITGAGTYRTAQGSGVYFVGAVDTVFNGAGGYIAGRLNGVSVGAQLHGFFIAGAAYIVNSGTVVGTAGYGIHLANGGTVIESGVATGGKAGIDIGGGSTSSTGSIVVGSTGTVQGTGSAGYGIRIAAGGQVNSSGHITGGTIGLDIGAMTGAGAGIVYNGAAITGSSGYGMRIGAGGTFVNTGTITGGKIGADIVGGAAARSTTFTNTGTLSGAIGFSVDDSKAVTSNTLIDVGTITGSGGVAVKFGAGNDLLLVRPGAVLAGNVDGGGGTNTLELATNPGIGTLSGLGTAVVNFGSIVFDAGANWKIAGDAAGLGGVISGFAKGDTIDLAGLHETVSDYSAGTLTLVGDATVALQLPGAFTALSFAANPDGAGGTALTVACFVSGTRVLTAAGDIPVEHLAPGDVVVTVEGRHAPVTWTGHRRVDCARHPRPQDVRPVRIRHGAFGPGMPARDLLLSPDHALCIADGLVPVRLLVDGVSIVQEAWAEVTYWHVALDAHDVLLAEGLPAESYLDTGNRAAFAGGKVLDLHPDFAVPTREARACRPLVTAGPTLDAARGRLRQAFADQAKKGVLF